MSNDNFSGTPATLTGEEISPQLYRTLDAAEMAGIQAAESRTARKIFLKIADRLKLSPADERREAKGGSPQKFWTPAQVEAVKAAYTPPTVTLADRVARIKKLSADVQRGVIEIGKNLAACKAEIGHGNWTKWLEENFQWNIRTAQRLITVAERFGNTTTLSHLNASTLQAMLALPVGTEQEFIDEQAACRRPVETQSARQVQAAVKQFKARKKISAPVIVGKPAQIDSPVIDVDATIGKQIVHTKITTNDTDAALDVVTKQIDSAEDSATVNHSAENDSASGIEPAQDSATVIEPADAIVDKSDAQIVSELVADPYEARRLEFVADMNKAFDEMIDSLLANVVHVEVLQHMRDYVIKRVDERLADFARAQKNKPAADETAEVTEEFADARIAALDAQKNNAGRAARKNNKSE